MRKFIIDTDTASDDAVALVMACAARDVQVEAVTVVAGNVPVDQGVQNALYTLELCGSHVPVFRGLEKPILRPLETAQFVHGGDGMGDIGLPLAGRQPADGHAVDVLIDLIRRNPGEVTVVALGPLSNLGAALLRAPELAGLVKQCVIMGGTGDGPGNVTPVAEYNIWTDPEAARIVFHSGMPIRMVGWDISWKYATFDPATAQRVRAVGTELAGFCMDIQQAVDLFAKSQTKLAGFDLPDPITMAIAIDPSLAQFEKWYVAVEIGDGLCRGQTIVDKLAITGHTPNVEVATQASHERFVDMLVEAVSCLPGLSERVE